MTNTALTAANNHSTTPKPPRRKEVDPVEKVVGQGLNVGAQLGRAAGGAAQFFVNSVGGIMGAAESVATSVQQHAKSTVQNALKDKYGTADSWGGQIGALDRFANQNNAPDQHGAPTTLDRARQLNADIENWTNSWVPAPQGEAAEFTAKAADALGEAIPATAVALATGGTVLGGTILSHAMGASNAFGKEMIEGTGSIKNAAIAGATEWVAEAIGGKLFDGPAGKISNKFLSGAAGALGEGAEEVMSGVAQAALTGDRDYGLDQMAEEFLLGTAVGGMMSGGVGIVNAARSEIGARKTARDIRAGKGDGPISGLSKSLDIAQANPEQYGGIARALAQPAKESSFDMTRFTDYVNSAVEASDNSSLRVPKNIENVSARNVGAYETLTGSGMKRAASVLEGAQVGKGLSPRQSGNILRAVLETNSNLYTKLAQVGGSNIAVNDTVQIERGGDYRSVLPAHGVNDNFAVVETPGRVAQRTNADQAINSFRGISSEWVLPTLEAGEFVVPNPAPAIDSGESGKTKSSPLFGAVPGQMLGAGLYLTSVPSKADQYTSSKHNEISMHGRDSSGVMAHGPIIGATTYVNKSALASAEAGVKNNIVRRGFARNGNQAELAAFMNEKAALGASEAAIVYSNHGNDYTEIVRPDATKTQIDRLYMPREAVTPESTAAKDASGTMDAADISASNSMAQEAAASQAGANIYEDASDAAELGKMRAEAASEESVHFLGNEDVNALLNQNIGDALRLESVVSDAESGNNSDAAEGRMQSETPAESMLNAEPSADEPPTTEAPPEEGAPTTENPPTTDGPPTRETPPEKGPPTRTDEPQTPIDPPATEKSPPSTVEPPTKETHPPETGEPSPPEAPPEEGPPSETPGERAKRIWTPVEVQVSLRDRDKVPKHDFDLVKGPGSQGQIYETTGYNATFGVLASY